VLPLACGQEFDPARDADFFATLPARPGVLLVEMTDAAGQPYMMRTADVRRAAERLLGPPDSAWKRLNLRGVAARIRYRVTGSKFEQTLAFYGEARARLPGRYRDLLRLRPPAVLKVNLRNAYPRCYVTRKIRGDGGFYFGPFASRRAAEAFAEGFLDLFKTRRCQIKIRRDPAFPGCIYSEMKMCLAPCFSGCTKDEYDAEVGRVLASLDTSGAALTEELEREREEASEALDFERAAALHKRLEKASGALRGLPELARRIEKIDAVILQRAAEEKTIDVYPVRGGLIGEPIVLRFLDTSEPRSVESILRKALDGENSNEPLARHELSHAGVRGTDETAGDFRARYGLREAPPELAEHLTLLARWFYSKPRDGEILFKDGEWPYRRILRACGRLLAPPAAPKPESTPANAAEPPNQGSSGN
jgi:excinuclease ABC subunit C